MAHGGRNLGKPLFMFLVGARLSCMPARPLTGSEGTAHPGQAFLGTGRGWDGSEEGGPHAWLPHQIVWGTAPFFGVTVGVGSS